MIVILLDLSRDNNGVLSASRKNKMDESRLYQS